MSAAKQTKPGPLVIGAGLMRTGTTSQMKALEMLLGGRCYHMRVLMMERKGHLKLWHKAATDGLTKELADEIFNGEFRSCTDYPAAHFYQELMEIYPSAKFVLSVREPQKWVVSVRDTIQPVWTAVNWMLPPVAWVRGLSHFVPTMDAILSSRLGLRFDMSDAEMIRAFDRHTESVIRAIPKERLLVFRVTDGWGPLCAFLGMPVPDAPFPNVNDTRQFQRAVRGARIAAVVGNLACCAAVGAGLFFGVRFCLKRWS